MVFTKLSIYRVSTYGIFTDCVSTNRVFTNMLRFAPEITIVSFQVHIWKFILDHVILALIENLSWSRQPLLSFILKEMDCGEMDFKNRAKQQQE